MSSRAVASPLDADELLVVTAVLVCTADLWAECSAQTGGTWPEGACVETSIMLRDEILAVAPDVEPAYVWGSVVVARAQFGHAWVGLRDGTIADSTIGQFLVAPPAYRLIRPGDPLAGYFDEQERPAYA